MNHFFLGKLVCAVFKLSLPLVDFTDFAALTYIYKVLMYVTMHLRKLCTQFYKPVSASAIDAGKWNLLQSRSAQNCAAVSLADSNEVTLWLFSMKV